MTKTIKDALTAGTQLRGGKYTIVKALAQGSFGITYLCKAKLTVQGQLGSMEIDANVAVKEFFMSVCNGRDGSRVTCSSSGDLNSNYKRKFRREAEHLSHFDHPHIVKVLELFEENDTCYYAMEYIEGGSLDDYIKQRGRLPEAEALAFARQIGEALEYMHSRNAYHLDVKPGNVMRHPDGRLALIDFGMTKQYNADGQPETDTGIGLGTPGYAPLEQADYHDGSGSLHKLDIYALGATLYRMLTGQIPPRASDINENGFPGDVLLQAGVSDGTIAIVSKAMASRRRDRPQSVAEFLSLLGGGEPELKPDPDPEPEPVLDPDVTDVTEPVSVQPSPEGAGPESEVEETSDTIAEPPKTPVPPPQSGSKSSDSPRSTLLAILLGVLVAVVVGVCVYMGTRPSEPLSGEDDGSDITDTVVVVTHDGISKRDQTATTTSGSIAGHEWVDLGLSVKWATCNVGASKPSSYGNYYAWGETTTKSTYTEENSKTWGKSIGSNIAGNATYDAARANWGDTWRLPTAAEFQELLDKCTWTWTTQGGNNGYRVTGPNGNSIFLPAAGIYGEWLDWIGHQGNYLSSTYHVSGGYSADSLYTASKLYFLDSDDRDVSNVINGRMSGVSVRPVSE